jgi:hypothetical protein
MPTLFKEGELLIVTPESVRAVIEVKTRLNSPSDIKTALECLATRKAVVARHVGIDVWAGLFVYDGEDDRHEAILRSLYEVFRETGTIIDFVTYGNSTVAKYFAISAAHGGNTPVPEWSSFHAPAVAPSNFIASLNEHLVPKDIGSFAWFNPPAGFKRRFVMPQTAPNATPLPYDV